MIQSIEKRDVTCQDCGDAGSIDTKMIAFGTPYYLEVTGNGKENGMKFYDTENGWLCEPCRSTREERRRELRSRSKYGPPEPPDEWRFCQSCGTQIDPTRIEGQFCGECATQANHQ